MTTMTTAQDTGTGTVTEVSVPLTNLHNAVKNAMQFVAPVRAGTPEILNTAHLFIRNGVLIVEATDRYKLIQVKVQDLAERWEEYSSEPKGWNVDIGTVKLDDLKNIERTLRADLRSVPEPMINLSWSEDNGVLEMQHPVTGSTQRIQMFIEAEYPKLHSLYYKTLPSEVSDYKNLGLEHIQAMAKIQHTRYKKTEQKLRVHGSRADKPLAVFWLADGEVWAQGLIMTLRGIDEDEAHDDHLGTYF